MNVCLVDTPHQLVNAIEAKHTLGLDRCSLVIVLFAPYPMRYYDPLLAGDEWVAVHVMPEFAPPRFGWQRTLHEHRIDRLKQYYRTFESWGTRRRLDRVARGFGHADTLLVGNYFRGLTRHFGNKLSHDRLVLLDDGTTTLNIAAARARHASGGVPHPYGSWTEPVVDWALGWDYRHADAVTFFTVYDLQASNGDSVIKHTYQHLRSRAARHQRTDEVYFLGQTLEWEGVREEDYIAQLQRVARHYADRPVSYLPHKGETPERVARVAREVGWPIRRFDVPIEYQLAIRGPLPGVLASFFSSALENCRIIFQNQLAVDAVYFDPELLPHQPEFVRDVYAYFETFASDHFQVVHL